MNSNSFSKVAGLLVITCVSLWLPAGRVLAATCSSYETTWQVTSGTGWRGTGGYVYSTQDTIAYPNEDHTDDDLSIANDGQLPSAWVQIGRGLGTTDQIDSSSPYIYTEQNNPSLSSSYTAYSYGPPNNNEGYWVYFDGYIEDLTQYGEPDEYQYQFDYGSYGNHAPNPGYLTFGDGYAWLQQEPDDQSDYCEPTSAYWGTNNGTPNTTYQMLLETSSGVWSQWNGTVGTSIMPSNSIYTWSELQNYWAAHTSD